MITIVVCLIAFVLLGGATLYNYMRKPKTGADAAAIAADETSKKKVVGGLTIASLVFLGISLLAGVWQYTIASKTINHCLSQA